MLIYSRGQKKFQFPYHSVILPVSTVPVRSVPYHSVHLRSNRLPRANSFSARREFVGKIHCVRWRSIARLFNDYIKRRFFPYYEKGYRPRPIALFIARVRAGPRGDGSARAYLYLLRFIIECTTSLSSLLVASDSPFLLQAT